MKRHIFISYKHDDVDFAEVLINRVEKAGFKTWVDNDKLRAGEDWRNDIDQAIKDAFALIVIMTPEARTSEYVTYEWAFAWGAGVKVIPVLYKETQLHPRLEALQHLNFTSRITRPWDNLIDVLKNVANQQPPPLISSPIPHSIPSYLKQAIEALDSANADDRKKAVDTLAELNIPLAHQTLIEALQHPLQDVRTKAAFKLAQAGDVLAVPVLLDTEINKYGTTNNFSAIEAICKLGNVAIPTLLDALHSKDIKIQKNAALALGPIKNTTAIPGLLEILHHEDQKVRENAIRSLGQIGSSTVAPILVEALHDKDRDVRASAAKALGKIKDITTISILVESLHDEYVDVRVNATEALGKIGDTTAIPGLLNSLNKDGGIQALAATALGEIGDNSAVPGLLEALYDKDIDVRLNAIKALGKIGDASAIPGLLELLNNENISKMQDTSTKQQLMGKQHRIDESVAIALVEIGDIGVPYLLHALQHKSWKVRNNVIEVLGNIKSVTSVPALLEVVRQDRYLKKSAIDALRKIGDVSAIPGLLEALHDDNAEIREIAVDTLGELRENRTISELIETLKSDGNQDILRASSRALTKMANAAVPALLDALRDEKVSARRKGIVASTLRQIGTPEALKALDIKFKET